jgi:arginyl-tRNA synthetase
MKTALQALLSQALQQVCSARGLDAPAVLPHVEATKEASHGDFASNLAMVCTKLLKVPPRVLAQELIAALPASPFVEKVELAGPGFINFFLTQAAFTAVIGEVLNNPHFGTDRSGQHGKVMVEFVSANPTGPMHVGHGRGAAYGDALARLLAATGWQVHREYYINDAGRQVDLLAVSVWLRYLGWESLPKRCYAGAYIQATADSLREVAGTRFHATLPPLPDEPSCPMDADEKTLALTKQAQERHVDALIQQAKALLGDDYTVLKAFAVKTQLAAIRSTLLSFAVDFDQWFSEQDLVERGFARTAIQRLKDAGHTFEQDGALWLRTSDFGDEKDRVLFKADGAATYFANDLAYHVDKLDRGFPVLVDVWGADHHGYIARVRAAIEALTGKKDVLNVALIQFVTLANGRMGKRSGNFVTLQDLLDEAGADATRFFFLNRSHDQHLEFDIDLARSQSNDNPVYYVQMAHARTHGVFRQLGERGLMWEFNPESLHRLSAEEEKRLLLLLNRYPEMLAQASSLKAPHNVTFYVRELADALHSYYNAHAFLVDDAELRTARLALVKATGQIVAQALGLLGVSAPARL